MTGEVEGGEGPALVVVLTVAAVVRGGGGCGVDRGGHGWYRRGGGP